MPRFSGKCEGASGYTGNQAFRSGPSHPRSFIRRVAVASDAAASHESRLYVFAAQTGLRAGQRHINPLPIEVVRIAGKLLGDEKLAIPDFPGEPINPVVPSGRTASPHQPFCFLVKKSRVKWFNWQAKNALPTFLPFHRYVRHIGEIKNEV